MAVMPPVLVRRPATVAAACRVVAALTVRVLLLLVPRTVLPWAVNVPVTAAVLANVAAPAALTELAKVAAPAADRACTLVVPPPDGTEMPPAETVRPPLKMLTAPLKVDVVAKVAAPAAAKACTLVPPPPEGTVRPPLETVRPSVEMVVVPAGSRITPLTVGVCICWLTTRLPAGSAIVLKASKVGSWTPLAIALSAMSTCC